MKKEIFYTDKKIKKTKIGIIADIHYYDKYNNKILENLKKQIEEEKPDYLVVAGDILDKANYKYDNLLKFFKYVSNICPVVMILGNHDTYIRNKKRIRESAKPNDFIEDINKCNNIYLLEDETYIDNNICFYGFSLPQEHYYKDRERYGSFIKYIGNINPKLDNKNYNIDT